MKNQPAKIYFIGVGGIGMSGLARYFKAQGCRVSGSDSTSSEVINSLRRESIPVKIGHKKANISRDITFVIYNRAIRKDNTELLAARKLSIPIIPYAKALGRLTEIYQTIAVTGSHGKSTTTALAGLVLARGGLDPTVLLGTNLKEFSGKNIRIGKSSYLVIEADDFGAAFLDYSPSISIITNIDREHLDFYKNIANIKRAFLKFISRTQDGGVLILNRDDKQLYSLKKSIANTAKNKQLHVVWYSTKPGSSKKIKKILKIPGEHNLSNAMAVFELSKLLKINEKKALMALGSYHGSWRRMEYRGEAKIGDAKVKIFDDYAHHPTEIKATLAAFKEKFPNLPLICVFQPHQPERLRLLFSEFRDAFSDADIVVLLPAYHVTGREHAKSKFTAEQLASNISRKYSAKKVYYLDQPKHIKKMLNELVLALSPKSHSSYVLVIMGAGDIVNYTDYLLK